MGKIKNKLSALLPGSKAAPEAHPVKATKAAPAAKVVKTGKTGGKGRKAASNVKESPVVAPVQQIPAVGEVKSALQGWFPNGVDLHLFNKGNYRKKLPPKEDGKAPMKKAGDGDVFGLRIVPDAFKTHQLKNKTHFVECTEEEFNQQFERA